MTQTFFSTLHPLSTVIFATATVLAFVLLRNSRFNFDCYTQHEATPTQKLARKCAATSCDFLHERLQSAFTLANQLRWIAKYICRSRRCLVPKATADADWWWCCCGCWHTPSLDTFRPNSKHCFPKQETCHIFSPCAAILLPPWAPVHNLFNLRL